MVMVKPSKVGIVSNHFSGQCKECEAVCATFIAIETDSNEFF